MDDLINGIATTIQRGVALTGETEPSTWRLGLGDGKDTIINTSLPFSNVVNIYQAESDDTDTYVSAVGTAILDEGLEYLYADGIGLEGTQVKCAKPPGETQLHVVRVDKIGAKQQFGDKPLAKQESDAGSQPALINVSTLKVAWSGNDDLVLLVGNENEAFTYYDSTGALKTFRNGEYDFTSTASALTAGSGNGQHLVSLLCIDRADGSLQKVSLAAVSADVAVPDPAAFGDDELDGISLAAYPLYLPVALIYSYYQQTAGADTDILDRDVRQWLTSIGDAFQRLPAGTELTESGDAITITRGYHTVKAQSGTTDDLATVSGGVGVMFCTLQAKSGHTITVKNGTGNIYLNGGADFVLSGDKTLTLFFDGTNWADTGAGGSSSTNVEDSMLLDWMMN